MPVIAALFREAEFSPGKVEADAAILERTAAALAARGHEIALGTPDTVPLADASAILAMCQSPAALAALDAQVSRKPVINTPSAIRNCYRTETVRLLGGSTVPFPRTSLVATEAPRGAARTPCWVKRGDVHAMVAEDVVFASDAAALDEALARFAARGIATVALQDHVEGAVIKFYGVADGSFFRCYSGDVAPSAPISLLWDAASAAARVLGLEVFGGDLVVAPNGTPTVVDVNDWPSFARCRDEAAEAIAAYVDARLAARDGRPSPGRPPRLEESRSHAR